LGICEGGDTGHRRHLDLGCWGAGPNCVKSERQKSKGRSFVSGIPFSLFTFHFSRCFLSVRSTAPT
jgi:hypothetical protein